MMILGIDPGERTSGVVLYDQGAHCVRRAETVDRAELEKRLRHGPAPNLIVCEEIVAMGVPFSSNLRETCRTIDRLEYIAQWRGIPWRTITRSQVKIAMCGQCRGVGDANVAAAVRERFGGNGCRGTKKNPGPLYGVSGHAWQALACVVAWLKLLEVSDASARDPAD